MTETLDLVLKGVWYDMIDSGEKKEEYREIKPYWKKRFRRCFKGKWFYSPYTRVRFHRGYTSKYVMCYEVKEFKIGFGRVDWGAPAHKRVFIIVLGKRL